MATDSAPLLTGGAIPAAPVPEPSAPPPDTVTVSTPPAQVNLSSQIRGTDLAIMALVAVTLVCSGLHAQARVLGIPESVLAVLDVLSPVIAMVLAVLRPLGSIKVPD